MDEPYFTTQSTIDAAINALRAGIKEEYLHLAMREAGFAEQRIETILRWAKRSLEHEV